MPKNGLSVLLLLAITGLFSALLVACTKHQNNSPLLSSDKSVGIIGGESVDSKNQLSDKVLFLALGVSIQKGPDGSQNASLEGHCTASALTTRIIITAGHCVEGRLPEQAYLVLTKDQENTPTDFKDWIQVTQIRIHDQYEVTDSGVENDVALLYLEKEIPSSRVLTMATLDQVQSSFKVTTIGYGITTPFAEISPNEFRQRGLHSVIKTVKDYEVQSVTFSIDQRDHRGFCVGDSGSPGIITNPANGKYSIIGVASINSRELTENTKLDPEGKYNMCNYDGFYINVLHPDIKSWISKTISEFSK